MLVEISVRREDEPLRDPAGWLLSGPDPGSWLAEIARWQLPDEREEDLRLFLVPRSKQDTFASGVLVAVPEGAGPAVRPAGVAYGVVGGRLFLPVEARLDPSIAPGELDSLLHHDFVVFHPAVGFIGFHESQVRHPSSLLAFPRLPRSRWQAPPATTPWNERIVALSLDAPVSLAEFFQEESREISSESPEDIPPDPDEPAEGAIEKWKRKVTAPLARGLEWFARWAAGQAGASALAGNLESWAQRKIQEVGRDLERLRNQELRRLLELLDQDPHRGLRHALPLGHGTHRGRARPGSRLVPRLVDFSLGGLEGGAPADPWDVPGALRQRLLAKYRELAIREKSLGRFRRAAYIYADLIGDVETAAAALKEGRHYREAAEVYRRHLHRPLEAARTYEAGGLLGEASELYLELEKYEEAGDVLRKMEREDKAREAYERARDRHLAEKDRVGASRIADAKLRDAEQAIEIASSGWPDSSQASECLRRQFQIQAREGLHQRTGALLERLEREATPPYLVADLASCLAETAARYPESILRLGAADLARKKISGRIRNASMDEASRLVASLYRLAPDDRLLVRDGARYLDARQERPVSPDARSRRSSPQPQLIRAFDLPVCEWLELRSTGSLFFALGRDDRRHVLVRGSWSGQYETVFWPLERLGQAGDRGGGPLLMELDSSGHRTLLVHGARWRFPEVVFRSSREVLEAETVAGDPGWIPGGTLALAHRASLWLALRYHRKRFVLSSYSHEGAHLADITDWESPEDIVDVHLAVQNQYLVVGQSREDSRSDLLVFDLGQDPGLTDRRTTLSTPESVVVGGVITGLRAALPHTRSRVAVTMGQGVLLRWLDSRESYLVAADMNEPKASLLRNGSLVVGADQKFRIYRLEAPQPAMISELSGGVDRGRVLEVVPGYAPNSFAALTTRGRVLLFVLPSG
jgi:MoxR-vWA-beta-propeller ternary system domain bpX3